MPSKHYAYLGPLIVCTTTSKATRKWRYGCPIHSGEWDETDNFCNKCGQELRLHPYDVCEDVNPGHVWDAFLAANLAVVDASGMEVVFEALDREEYHFVPPDELWLIPTDSPNLFVQGTAFAATAFYPTDEQCELRSRYAEYFKVLEELFDGHVRTEFGMVGYRS